MAVAVRGNLHDEIDVEMRAVLNNSQRIFRHFTAEYVVCVPIRVVNGVKVAITDTPSASDTFVMVDERLAVFLIGNGVLRADFDALTAFFTRVFINGRFAGAMLFHFAGALAGYFLLKPFLGDTLLGVVFAGVAGIMVYISFDELLPAAREYGKHHLCVSGLFCGMALMAVSLTLF